jgi:TolA-binding protein
MRSKLNDRSLSIGDRSQSADRSTSNSKVSLALPLAKRRLPPTQRTLSRKTVTSYEQEHLIFSLEEENK